MPKTQPPADVKASGLLAQARRDIEQLQRRPSGGAAAAPTWVYDEWTAAGTPVTTYPLSFIPTVDSIAVYLGGHWLRPSVDYTVNSLTGILTVSATLTAGDVISAHYTTDGGAGATPGPVTYVGSATRSSSNIGSTSTAGTLTLPGGISDNDYILLGVTADDAAATMITPTGFSLLLGPTVASSGVGPKLWVFYRVGAAADSGASVSLSFGGTINNWSALARVYNGATTFDAQAIQGNGASASTTIAIPGLTLFNTGDLLVSFYAFVTTNGSATLLTPATYGNFASVSPSFSPFVTTGSGDVTASGTTDNTNAAGCTVAVTSVAAKIAFVQ